MKVKFPEPIGAPIIYYERRLDKKFNHQELEKLLREFERDLDILYERIDDRVAILSCELSFENAIEELGFVSGGMDLSVSEGRKYSLPEFRNQYKRTLKEVLEKAKNLEYPIKISISILGFGDKISHSIEAREL